jgi:hypothetical protein
MLCELLFLLITFVKFCVTIYLKNYTVLFWSVSSWCTGYKRDCFMQVSHRVRNSSLERLPLDVLLCILSLSEADERRLLSFRCLNRYFHDVCVPQLFALPCLINSAYPSLNTYLSARLNFSRCIAQIRAHHFALNKTPFVNGRVRKDSLRYFLHPDIRSLCSSAEQWDQWAVINRKTSCLLYFYRQFGCLSRDQMKRCTGSLLSVTMFLLIIMMMSLFALSACRDLQINTTITLVNESHIFIPFLCDFPVPHPQKCDAVMWMSGVSISLVSYSLCLLLLPCIVSFDVGSHFLSRLHDKIQRQSDAIVAKNQDDVERAFSRFPYLQEPLLVSDDECGAVAEFQPLIRASV